MSGTSGITSGIPKEELTSGPSHARRENRITLALLCALLSLPLFVYFARLDPEPHHDGVQFAAALAIADGLPVHSVVFSQYGPLTAWAHALALAVFGPHLIVLRVFTAILLSLAVFLTVWIGSQLGLSRWINVVVTATFVMTFPTWSLGGEYFSLWPWPSVTFLVLTLLATSILLPQASSSHPNRSAIAVAGFFIGLGIMTRLNYGTPVALLALGALFIVWQFQKNKWQLLGIFTGAIAIGVAVVLLPLIMTGALGGWFAQAILGPLGSSSAVFPAERFQFVFAHFVLAPIPFVLALGALLLFRRKIGEMKLGLVVATSGLIGLMLLIAGLAGSGTRLRIAILNLWDSPVSRSLLDVQPIAPLYVAAWLLPIILLMHLTGRYPSQSQQPTGSPMHTNFNGQRSRTILTAAIGFGALAQLFPLFDAYHLWWAGPLGLVLLGQVLSQSFSQPRATIITAGLLVPFVLLGAVNAGLESRWQRTSANGVALEGMLMKVSAVDQETAVAELVARAVPGQTRVLCDDGLVSGWMGEYLPATGAYVDWAWGLPEKPANERYILICLEGSTTPETLQLLEDSSSSIVGRTPELSLSPSSSFSLVLLDRNLKSTG